LCKIFHEITERFSGYVLLEKASLPMSTNLFKIVKITQSKTIFGHVLVVLFLFGRSAAGAAGSTWDIGQVASGQCLYTSLKAKQLPARSIHRILSGLRAYMDFDRIPPDTAYRVVLDPRGELQEFTIESGRGLLHLSAGPTGDAVHRSGLRRAIRIETASGRLQSDSGGTIRIVGEAPELIHRFEKVLSQEVDSAGEFQQCDRFRLVVEKIYECRQLLRYGRIEAFELHKEKACSLVIRFKGEYYDEAGRSLKEQFLRVPLHYQFVSCEFMKARKHPILGGVRPHHGIDFVAPYGTAVWAVADGQVVIAGWLNGYGRTVVLRHACGYESLYAHLSGFGPGIHEGVTVMQKQVIGFIGTTGLSTGPHLHYGLTKDGVYRDPLKEAFPRAAITDKEEMQAFQAKKKMIRSILAVDTPTAPSAQ
jgi:murein DD-endopeptidase MepM/ murein hydrolase activator NlpD